MSDNESDEPDDPLLNQKKLIVLTSQYTNFELEQAFNNMYTIVKIRQQRRLDNAIHAANQASMRYINNNPFVLAKQLKWVDYQLAKFTFSFEYGENYTGTQYVPLQYNNDDIQLIKPWYAVSIECVGWKEYSVSLEPPEHHVVSLPVECVTARDAVKNATLTYLVTKNDVQIKSNITKRVRKDIFGDLLVPFVKHFIHDGHAGAILDTATRVYNTYDRHHIGNVNSATISFLMIGRLRKLGECHVPYDVVKMIASYVWASRYKNNVWNISIPERPRSREVDGVWEQIPRLLSEESNYGDPYNENSIHDWIKGPPTFDKKI
jgi:hypothetical protein